LGRFVEPDLPLSDVIPAVYRFELPDDTPLSDGDSAKCRVPGGFGPGHSRVAKPRFSLLRMLQFRFKGDSKPHLCCELYSLV
jgi:hypothetical protein